MVGWAQRGGVRGVEARGRSERQVAESMPPTWGGSDPETVRQASSGCEEAFVALYGVLCGRVRRTAECILRDAHAAEDAVQDTFLAVLEGLPELSDPEAFEGWVMRIARHKAISVARRRTRCPPSMRVHYEDSWQSPHDEPIIHRSGAAEPGPLTVVLLRAAYSELAPGVRETLRLKYLEGLSCEAVARAQGVSLSCVKTRLHRGRKELYDAIGRRVR